MSKRTTVPAVAPVSGAAVGAAVDAAAGGPGYRVHQLYHLPPADLRLADNIRTDVDLDDAFLEDVSTNGVLAPLLAYADDQGALAVWDGQRRLAAALDAGLEFVPVFVTARAFADADAYAVARIVEQYRVNQHRAGLTETDEVGAFQQLALLGLDVDAIVASTQAPAAKVSAAVAIAGSGAARHVADERPDVPLDHLAAIAELDADRPTGVAPSPEVARLVEVAGSPTFRHELQQVRDQRAVRARLAELAAEADVTVVNRDDDGPARPLRPYGLTEADHAECQGRVLIATPRWTYGAQDGGGWVRVLDVATEPGCADPDGYGHELLPAYQRSAPASSAGLSPAEAAALKAERAQVRTFNADAEAAAAVRDAFVRDHVVPAKEHNLRTAVNLLAIATTGVAAPVSSGLDVLDDWLGDQAGDQPHPRWSRDGMAGYAKKHARTAATGSRWLLLWAFASAESGMRGKSWWRNPSPLHVAYLRALERLGYELADVERHVVDGADR